MLPTGWLSVSGKNFTILIRWKILMEKRYQAHWLQAGPSSALVLNVLVSRQENEGSSLNGEHSSNESSQNSVDGMIISHPLTASSSVQVTSATVRFSHAVSIDWGELKRARLTFSQEATTSDPDENDSALERSYSLTPDRDEPIKQERTGFSFGLSAASSSLAKSRNNLLNFFSSRMSLANTGGTLPYPRIDVHVPRATCLSLIDFVFLPTDDGDEKFDGPSASDDHSLASDDDSLASLPKAPYEYTWGYRGICVLLVMLCLSAAVLWYRVFLLHSHLELRLAPGVGDVSKSSMNSLYSPQVWQRPLSNSAWYQILKDWH